jgi:zinc finger-like protein
VQVFPLFKKYFSFDEQAVLLWEFLCSIPLNFIEKFLPWISASLSVADHEQMVRCMYSIVPNEDALLQVSISNIN